LVLDQEAGSAGKPAQTPGSFWENLFVAAGESGLKSSVRSPAGVRSVSGVRRVFVTDTPGEVTRLLAQFKGGNERALEKLVPIVYKELRRLAGHYLRGERPAHTLQPTALVHEAYLRLVGLDRIDWQNHAQFMAVAGQMMRRILVNHAAGRGTKKRTSPEANEWRRLDQGVEVCDIEGILAVDEALGRLSALSPRQAQVVELRYFAGFTVEETAEALGLPLITVKREWAVAKAWLRRELSGREAE
jgi:RNA polymerase sigma-70 factor, ECF subfamily